MQSRTFLFLGIAAGVIIAIVAGTLVFQAPYQYQGSVIQPPVPATDFSLVDQNGNPFQLSNQQGKVVLIFFGYTNCPDVCPATMADFHTIRDALGDRAAQVSFLFITVDPQRDNPERLKTYLANFDPAIVGLTGDDQVLEVAWKGYGVYHETQNDGSASGYSVDHSAFIYAVDKQGNLRTTYQFGFDSGKIEEDVVHLLAESTSS
jgi:protein SCO1/2